MMRVICCLLLIVVTVERSYGVEDIGKIVADCKNKEKLSDAEVMNFKNKVYSETKEAKCLATCILENLEIIKNNQLNGNAVLELAKMMPNFNEKTMKSASEVVEDCKSFKEPERCEFGFRLSKCLMEAAAKRQLGSMLM